jgi:hypothetical protein
VDTNQIISAINEEISRLTTARDYLSGTGSATSPKRGRPAGKKNGGNGLSPAGRKRIAAAMKKRWAERRKELAAAK